MEKQGAGRVISNEKKYRSQKHPLLEYIFHKYNPDNDTSLELISFTLADISEAYRAVQVYRIDKNGNRERIQEPASISNTILDLVRQNRGIQSRVPDSLIELGYDLRKKTGDNIAGEFVFVGRGNELTSWITWSATPERISIDSTSIPPIVFDFLRKDEGALFSVIDYCDILSQALYGKSGVVIRVQHPLKWQPNEIDGFYVGMIDDVEVLFPIEAKALTTHDEINLDQILGGVNTISSTLQDTHAHIVPMAVKMISNGILIAVFSTCEAGEVVDSVDVERTIEVTFNPPIHSWQ
jgi:hypothetical protein